MKEKNEESLNLAEEILKNIELNEIPLGNIVLKCARLARLVNNQSAMDWFKYELAGYPKDDNGFILGEAFNLARFANRVFKQKDNEKITERMFSETVSELENELESAKEQMKVAYDRNISIASSAPDQWVHPPAGNMLERNTLRQITKETAKKIDQLKTAYYNYVSGVSYELRFGDITEDIFQRRRIFVNKYLSDSLPETVKKLVSVYENLRSSNDEDWANAVHSCRRIIKDVADLLCPSTNEEIEIGNGKKIKLTDQNYIIRLKQYIKDKEGSEKFQMIVGGNLDYIGNRLDAIYDATNKGTHTKVSKIEAEQYIIYAYVTLGDILSL